MNIGISSACFYPLETEKSLIRLGEMGVKKTEIFFNAPSEIHGRGLKEIQSICRFYGIEVLSCHPFLSFAEGFNLYSNYKRRYIDCLDYYKTFFECAAILGAPYTVFHGGKNYVEISNEEYAQRFSGLIETGAEFGVTATHENVVNFIGESPDFMAFMKSTLGNKFKMTLDIKQARRAKQNPYEFIDKMKESIVHLHLSDCLGEALCTQPKDGGETDFKQLFAYLKENGFKGNAVLELYRNNFENECELLKSVKYMEAFLN